MPRPCEPHRLRPGFPTTAGRRRSLSEPPQAPQQPDELSEVPEYCRDPRYAEWYYKQRVRPNRYPPPVATAATCDRVAAARHRQLPGTGRPLPLPSRRPSVPSAPGAADGNGACDGWEHARESGRAPDPHRPPPLSPVTAAIVATAAAPPAASPATSTLVSDFTPGPSSTPMTALTVAAADVAGVSLPPSQQQQHQQQLRPTDDIESDDPTLPPLWRETSKYFLPVFQHTVKITGVGSTRNKPVKGDTRESSGAFQAGLLRSFAAQFRIPHPDVIGVKLIWDFTNQCQADKGVIGLRSSSCATQAAQLQSFTYQGATIRVHAHSEAAAPNSPTPASASSP